MASKYAQGRDTEYLCQRELLASGWQSIRSAGSHKEADVLAWNEQGTRYIQCKRYTDRPGDFTADISKLMSINLPPFASAELWVRQAGKHGWIERTLIKHTFPTKVDVSDLDDMGNEKNFTRPINPDKVKDISIAISMAAKAERWKDKQRQTRKQFNPAPTTAQWERSQKSSTNSRQTETPRASGTVAQPSERGDVTPA